MGGSEEKGKRKEREEGWDERIGNGWKRKE